MKKVDVQVNARNIMKETHFYQYKKEKKQF